MKQIEKWFVKETPVMRQAFYRADNVCHTVTRLLPGGGIAVILYKASPEEWARFVAADGVWSNADARALEIIDAVGIPREVIDALLA